MIEQWKYQRERGLALTEVLVAIIGIVLLVSTAVFGIIQFRQASLEMKAKSAEKNEAARAEAERLISSGDTPSAPAEPAVAVTTPAAVTPSEPFNWTPFLIAGLVIVLIAVVIGAIYLWRAHLGPRAHAAQETMAQARTQRAAAKTAWDGAVKDEKSAIARWLSYEKDIALAMRYPFMRDLTNDLVSAVVSSMSKAAGLRGGSPSVVTGREAADQPYVVAVRDFVHKLDVAESHAQRVGDSLLTSAQQKSLHTAQQMLRIVQDASASPYERASALEQMTRHLRGIIVVPPAAMAEIEASTGVRVEIAATQFERTPA